MTIYIRLEPEEELAIKRTVLEAIASSITFQNTGIKIAKLKRQKRHAMKGTVKSINELAQEITKIGEMLPIESIKPPIKPKEKKKPVKTKKRKKTKYELELEKIRKKIATLS